MALPRTMIGAGIGSALGAGAGALSVKKDPNGGSTVGKRLRRAAVGGVLGGAAGFGVHGAARTSRMPKTLMPTGGNAEAFHQGLRTLKAQGHGHRSEAQGNLRYIHSKIERARHGFLGPHRPGDTLTHLRKENPFQGMSPVEAKKHFDTQVLKHHPDRGGSREAFQPIVEQHRMHRDFHKKTGSIALDEHQWDFFFDELEKLANLSKSPSTTNSIKQSVQGTKPKATSPSSPGIMPMGQSGATATTSPLPKPAQS